MKIIYIYLIIAVPYMFSSCNKYLDAKPDKKLVVPSTVSDLQAILDDNIVMNSYFPGCLESAADNYFVTTADWQARNTTDQNSYTWQADVFNDNELNDWSQPYVSVYFANVVLDALDKGVQGSASVKDNIKGAALFYRSFSFYHLLQLFAKPWSKDSAAADKGIVLRLSSDLNLPSTRASVKDCYDQIQNDLLKAAQKLPDMPGIKMQPSKAACFALLARAYLSMAVYDKALLYADSALQINNALMDYNTLNANAANPVPRFNQEVYFHGYFSKSILSPSRAKIDTLLYRSYNDNDLRKTIFYTKNTDGSYAFKGGYDNSSLGFSGLATDEMYLIKAECYARADNAFAAMQNLNTLLQQRWKKGTFAAFTAIDAADALSKILAERRRELLFRGIRWSDLRRLNKEPQWAVTLTRAVNGNTYTLLPNSNAYVFPIPLNVINLTGIAQNPR